MLDVLVNRCPCTVRANMYKDVKNVKLAGE